jgi:hypothetical protein
MVDSAANSTIDVVDYFSEVTSLVEYMRNYHMIKELNENEASWDYFMQSNTVRRLYSTLSQCDSPELNDTLIKIRILQLIHFNSMKFIENFENSMRLVDRSFPYTIEL